MKKMLVWKYVDLAVLPPARGITVKNAGQLCLLIQQLKFCETNRGGSRMDLLVYRYIRQLGS